jgi:hypothetical protein
MWLILICSLYVPVHNLSSSVMGGSGQVPFSTRICRYLYDHATFFWYDAEVEMYSASNRSREVAQ